MFFQSEEMLEYLTVSLNLIVEDVEENIFVTIDLIFHFHLEVH